MARTVLAVDGGNSKTDVALVSETGELLARVRAGTVSHQAIGAQAGGERLAQLVNGLYERVGKHADGDLKAEVGVYCLAGADFSSDVRLIRRELARYALAREEIVLNDCFAPLRSGASQGWGIVLICGQGINGAGVAPDRRMARFAGIGSLSGDWGGAGGLGQAAMAAAIRARDGRGPRTSLEQVVARHFGRRTPEAVMLAMYEDRISSTRLSELAPAVFAESEAGDAVAQGVVDRLADELVAMAVALIRRLRLRRLPVEVVLAGGVFNTTNEHFYERLETGIRDVAPRAKIVRPRVPPVAGAALLALDRLTPSGKTPRAREKRLLRSFADDLVGTAR